MRLRSSLAVGLVVALASACGNNSGHGALPPVGRTPVHVALPAGPDPSESAKMVCAPEARKDLTAVLGLSPVSVSTPTWEDHLYTCRYTYPDGAFVLSVKELLDKSQTTAYFDMLGTQMGRTGSLNGLGQGGFTTTDGDAVVRKDYKVLLVDISGLPAQFGVPPTSRSDIAVTIADVIMGCWSGS